MICFASTDVPTDVFSATPPLGSQRVFQIQTILDQFAVTDWIQIMEVEFIDPDPCLYLKMQLQIRLVLDFWNIL